MVGAARGPDPEREPDRSDLDSLVGLRSVKGSHYAQYRGVEARLSRVVGALERISRALVRTAEGPEALVISVVEAARDHLGAEWVVFGLADGRLERSAPRHLISSGSGRLYAFEGSSTASPPDGLPDQVLNRLNDILRGHEPLLHRPILSTDHVHVPVELDGSVVGGLSAWTPSERVVDPTDVVVLRILASQAIVALLNAELFSETHRHAAELAERNDELERAQRELSAAMRTTVLNEERSRIARELHDSVTQSVLSAGVQIELFRDLVDGAALERLQMAGRLTKEAVEQLRTFIYTLNNAASVPSPSVREVLTELCSLHMPPDLTTAVRIRGRARDLTGDVQHALLRIAGEALFNAAIHARADEVTVTLTYAPEQVSLSVDDDGVGDPEHLRRVLRTASLGDLAAGRHRGLANMASRAAELDGEIRIRRSRAGGIRVTATLPTGAGSPSASDPGTTTRELP
ncbi:MadS family sensor histidine kinase [Gordonia amicalis]|uniref:histidine kinase n=1 Tax=Gordonia amicalis TaxID=89053 RepID=A0ABU4DJ08_9ACTN|nr:GAF domain-containing sensor histidine kinase [Gordonia amicalis]MDJ0452893.1 histidine kinase [Gordonia amicalis]MDV6309734.1 histidine kinase [Gordonia amicalis]MDV7075497.1 histidine kinase [Gordonia amicalis]MDV7102227.1 histidine kinase [Gordonia amicalis]